MIYLILALIVAINVGQLLLPRLDVWHATGLSAQAMILLIFAWSFFEKPRFKDGVNKPVGALVLWCGFTTIIACYQTLLLGRYNIVTFLPFFNFLCIIILYRTIVQYLNIPDVMRVMRWLKYSVIGILILCTLQKLGLSQFFQLLNPTNQWHNNIVVGTVGNGTHLSGFLGSCSPLFFSKKREDILSLVLLIIVLLFSGTGTNDISISGFAIIIALCGFYLANTNRKFFLWYLGAVFVGACVVVAGAQGTQLFDANGRIGWWTALLRAFPKYPITGFGLGAINEISRKITFPRHAHMEYIHFMFELGVVGAALIVYFIKDFFSIQVVKFWQPLRLMFIGFLLSCCFNYPAHLWVPSIYACIAYGCLVAVRERTNAFNS